MPEENGLFARNAEQESTKLEQPQVDTEKYLVVTSAGVLYGVNTRNIQTILTEISITWLPMLPSHIRGVINLRGAVVPILDFRLLLGQQPGEKSCTIVLDSDDGTQIGIMVDEVDQTVDIETERILPVPSQTAGEHKLVSGMCSLPSQNGTLMVLDCSLLFNGQI